MDTLPPGDCMRWIPGGTFRMGDDNAYLEEAPAHAVAVSSFWIDAYVVTNANFAAFVTATGYRTVAERPVDPAAFPGADPSLLVPGSSVFFMPTSPANLCDIRSRWAYVPGAYWGHPEGPGSSIEGREHDPVVHVAFEDEVLQLFDFAEKPLASAILQKSRSLIVRHLGKAVFEQNRDFSEESNLCNTSGAETATWPDGGTTPFHGEKGTTWEGGFRVPMLVRWPGVIEPVTIYNDIFSQEDRLPTLLAAAGEPDIVEKVKKGYAANGKTWKVHLDGYNFLPYFKGESKKGPREEIFYFGQGGDLSAIRWNDWKVALAT